MANTPDVRIIKLSEIRENPVALRAVNRENEDYIGLRDSILEIGILNPINVRKRTEEVDGKIIEFFELVDGLHRYSAALDVGLEQIPVLVVSLDDARTLEAQIMANVHKVETRPVEYTRQLQRIFAGNPTLTLAEMAAKINKSPAWISQRLNLLKLESQIQKLVDDGKIKVANAVQLAKLPVEEQLNYLDQAMQMVAEEFVPIVQLRAKELRDAARQGREAKSSEFVATARLQKLSALKAEHENPAIGTQLCKECGVKSVADAFALGIAWALSLDPVSVKIRAAQDAEKKTALEDAKKKRAAERATKKAAEAAKAAAEAQEAVTSK